ncbi:type II toxin-antitoxin system Phd/YefM family antitoxin [Acinetobacter soli]|uniref:type II toxin-antitoxin system Phd/YefM family antitoxin n=1 Tax=Acinetobacter soli TaxID=487316 RepID=UPI00125DFF1A|nr:type II toxin-antitoxin system prevent-host-death family antitoxin [Acinetobacter soli]
MKVCNYSEAQNNLKSVLDGVFDDADTALITRKEGQHAVVMTQDHYESLMETLYLLSSPANAARLNQSIAEFNVRKSIQHDLLLDEDQTMNRNSIE